MKGSFKLDFGTIDKDLSAHHVHLITIVPLITICSISLCQRPQHSHDVGLMFRHNEVKFNQENKHIKVTDSSNLGKNVHHLIHPFYVCVEIKSRVCIFHNDLEIVILLVGNIAKHYGQLCDGLFHINGSWFYYI